MQLNPTHYNNKAEKVKWLRYLHRQSEDTPTKQACNLKKNKKTDTLIIVVNCILAKSLTKYFPEDGDLEEEPYQDKN